MELKGIITLGKPKFVNCCTEIQDLLIDGNSLYEALEALFDQDIEKYYYAPWTNPKQSPTYGLKYVILDEPPEEEKSFNDQSAEVINNLLLATILKGCYSEYTCGYGGFDYLINDNRSIFDELESYVGKYIHLEI